MKLLFPLFAVVFIVLVAGTGKAAETPAPADPKIAIVPHRAVYTMNLSAAKNGSPVTDVTGQLAFEWADTCDGWAVQQHTQLHFNYTQGTEANIKTDVVSWEAKDGKRYNFNVRRTTNGKETENYRGRAALDDHGGSGVYAVPKDRDPVALPAGALFPSSHTLMILQHAVEGDKLFTRRVFDGSDEVGHADISAFIGASSTQDAAMEPTELRGNPLLAAPEWPIRLAFYKPESQSGTPDYEMDLTLLANGVARTMRIDYGDFSVSGILSKLEALPPSGC